MRDALDQERILDPLAIDDTCSNEAPESVGHGVERRVSSAFGSVGQAAELVAHGACGVAG